MTNSDALTRSFKHLIANPKLFIPDLVLIAVSYLMLYLIYLYTGVGDILTLLQNASDIPILEVLKNYIIQNLPEVIISFVIFVIVTFFLGVGVIVMRFEMIKDILKTGNSSLRKAWKAHRSYFWSVVFLRLLIFLISIIALGVVFLGSGLFYLILNPFSTNLALSISAVIAILLTMVLVLLIKFAIMFRYPIMFLKGKKNSWKILKDAITFFKKDPLFVIITWAIIFLVGLAFSILGSGLGLLSSAFSSFITVSIILTVLVSIINILIDLSAELWGAIYLFDKFNSKK
ncbi:MAG: hypothetical protein Q8Q35_03215 [Nanoarchaeota archaeon]|nr:hypothetical protein [Nanoarchaeota archaeon]